jgi:hypothetical protein
VRRPRKRPSYAMSTMMPRRKDGTRVPYTDGIPSDVPTRPREMPSDLLSASTPAVLVVSRSAGVAHGPSSLARNTCAGHTARYPRTIR